MGFPGGSVVKNLSASAGDEFNPWSGKTPHAEKQLSQTQLLKTVLLEPVLCNKRGHHNVKPV